MHEVRANDNMTGLTSIGGRRSSIACSNRVDQDVAALLVLLYDGRSSKSSYESNSCNVASADGGGESL